MGNSAALAAAFGPQASPPSAAVLRAQGPQLIPHQRVPDYDVLTLVLVLIAEKQGLWFAPKAFSVPLPAAAAWHVVWLLSAMSVSSRPWF